jgi:hypothetical protein
VIPSLTQRLPPWAVFTCRDDPWWNVETATLRQQGGSVFRLDGRELREQNALFVAFARELSFPGYFGHNWDALVDCLHDWHGHEGRTDDVVVLIDHADDLRHAGFLGLFVSVLCQAARQANLQLDADGFPNGRPPRALHFVFLLDDLPPAAFAESAATGTDVKAALAEGRLTATLTGEDWPDAGEEIAPRRPRQKVPGAWRRPVRTGTASPPTM